MGGWRSELNDFWGKLNKIAELLINFNNQGPPLIVQPH